MKKEIKRKIVHSLGVFMAIYGYYVGSTIAFLTFFPIFLFLLLYSVFIEKYESKNVYEKKLRNFILDFERGDHEKMLLKGACSFFLSFSLAFLFLPPNIAAASCTILSIGDSFSNIVGRKLGRIKLTKKTIEGTISFILSSIPFAIIFVDPIIAIFGSVFGSIGEFIEIYDDNISIVLFSSASMLLASNILLLSWY